MARYRRRRRYKRYRRYRRFYRKAKNLINASSRSRCTIKARSTFSAGCVVAANQNFSAVGCFNPFIARGPVPAGNAASGCYPFSTVEEPVVQNFCYMYDEVKVDSCVIKVTVTSPVGLNGVADAIRFWTAWDRKGTYSDTFADTTFPTPNSIRTLPSANVVMLSNNTVNTFYRFCKASDFFEKYCFVDATQKKQPARMNGVTVDDCQLIEAWYQADSNIINFTPTFYFCIETVNFAPTVNLAVYVAFEMTTYYTFRNPKYGQSSGGAIQLKRKQEVEVGVGPPPTREPIAVEDAVMDFDEIGTTTRSRNRERIASMLGVDPTEVKDIYAASDPKNWDDSAPPSRRRRVSFGSTDADINITSDPPPAAVAAADTAFSKNV